MFMKSVCNWLKKKWFKLYSITCIYICNNPRFSWTPQLLNKCSSGQFKFDDQHHGCLWYLFLSIHAESVVLLIPTVTHCSRVDGRTGGGEEEKDNSDEQLLFGVKHSCVRVLVRERPSSRCCVVFVPSWAPDSVREMQTFPRISSNRIPLLLSSSHPSTSLTPSLKALSFNAPSALTLCPCFGQLFAFPLSIDPGAFFALLPCPNMKTQAVLIVSMTAGAMLYHCIYVLHHKKFIVIR